VAALEIVEENTALNLDIAVVLGDRAGRGDRSNPKILANNMQLSLKNRGGLERDLVDRTNPSTTRPLTCITGDLSPHL